MSIATATNFEIKSAHPFMMRLPLPIAFHQTLISLENSRAMDPSDMAPSAIFG
jgi:hypothetical protein